MASSEVSTRWPSPVRSRSQRAATTASAEAIPVPKSLTAGRVGMGTPFSDRFMMNPAPLNAWTRTS